MADKINETEVKTPKPMAQNKHPVKSWSECVASSPSPISSSSTQSLNSKASLIGNGNNSNNGHSNSTFSISCSTSTSKTSSRPPSRPMSTILILEEELEGLILDSKMDLDSDFLQQPLTMIKSRPIANPGNRCYMISVLQVLLHSKPFTNYLVQYFFELEHISEVLATGKYPLLCGLKLFYEQFTLKAGNTNVGAERAVSYESIDMMFMALQGKMGSFSGAGFDDQEDAEEFLTSFLDALGDEFTALKQGSSGSFPYFRYSLPFETTTTPTSKSINNNDDDGGDWLQKVGPKQKIATTRRTPLSQTPIHLLFAGNFQSVYKCFNARPSITFEPFTVLSLEIMNERRTVIESIPAALNHLIRCEELKESSSAPKATKQLSFSTLPPLLILQLKRFIYRRDEKTGQFDLHKITHPIKITQDLEFDLNRGGYVTTNGANTNILKNHNYSSNKSTNTSTSNITRYQLYSIVNHHGATLHGGHYTSHVLHQNDWHTFDDEQAIQLMKEESVLSFKNSCNAYLLFYQRV